jgi:serine/threonine-protein kinase
MAMGDYHYYGRRDFDQALEHYVMVQRRQPSNSDALALIAWIQRRQAEWDRSLINAERALELDPRNTVWVTGQAQNYFYLRRYDEAEPYFLQAISLAADVPYYYRWAAYFYLAWDGNTDRAERIIEDAAIRFSLGELFVGNEASWVLLDVFGARYAGALDELSLDAVAVDSAYYYLARASVSAANLTADGARAYYDSAASVLSARVDESPGESAPHSALGIALAGLGQRVQAISEGLRGVELLPISRDAMTGSDRLRDLARIYVMVGDYEAAIVELEHLLSIPSPFSADLLRVDSFWDPLRSYPAFQGLIDETD